MAQIDVEIQQLLEMVPYLSTEERTELLAKLPDFTVEKKETIRNELWRTIRALMAKVPIESFMKADFNEQEKAEILRIEEAYLHDLRKIEGEMRKEFLSHEHTVRHKDEKKANTLLLQLA